MMNQDENLNIDVALESDDQFSDTKIMRGDIDSWDVAALKAVTAIDTTERSGEYASDWELKEIEDNPSYGEDALVNQNEWDLSDLTNDFGFSGGMAYDTDWDFSNM